MSPKLLKRIISALVIAPIFLYAIIQGGEFFITWIFIAFAISVYEWFHLSRKTEFFVPCFVIGIVYMSLSFASFLALREVYSVNIILLFIGMIWFSDIGAYFIGKTIGGPKLIHSISPNKTWSGFGGALFFPAVFSAIWIHNVGFHEEFRQFGWLALISVAFIIGVVMGSVGQAGDLMVSFVKRKAQVKDTGTLIPGHGGILDRIDSMLLGAPVFFLLITLMSYVF